MSRITRRYAKLFREAKGKPEDEQSFWEDLQNDFTKKNVGPQDFSVRELFEEFVCDGRGNPCGREIISSWMPDGTGQSLVALEETGPGAVTTSAFSNITGQIVYNAVLEAWNQPEFIAGSLAKTVPTSFLDGEKIAGISVPGDDAEALTEAQPYPVTGITEQYVETPRPVKRGHILPLTREAIIADRTGVLLERAGRMGNTMAMNKEKRVVDMAIGASDTWKRNGSAATAVYANSGAAPHNFDNLSASTGLADYTDINAAMLLFDAMTDPETGEPIVTRPNQILVASANLYTARRIVNSTEIIQGAISATVPRTVSANPLNTPGMGGAQASPFEILTSPYVGVRLLADSGAVTTWYIGDFQRAFRYMEVWPLSVTPMPSNSQMEFQQDIVRAWKVSEFGVPAVVEPRHVVKCTA